jgi:hypothetical protein
LKLDSCANRLFLAAGFEQEDWLVNDDTLSFLAGLVVSFPDFYFSSDDTRLSLTIELWEMDWWRFPFFFYIFTL